MAKKTILFIAYGGGHATMLAPIVKALQTSYGAAYNIRVLNLTTARKTYDSYGITYDDCSDFLLPEDTEIRSWGEELAKTEHNPAAGVPYTSSVAYLGFSYYDLVQTHGEEEAARLYKEKGRLAFLPLTLIRRVYDIIMPDLVVTTNAPRAEMAALLVAQERNITSLVVTDLMGNWSHPIVTDHITVLNKLAEECYRKLPHVQAKHYHVLGNPAMDQALSIHQEDPAALRKKLLPPELADKKCVLLYEQHCYYDCDIGFIYPEGPERYPYLNNIAAACNALGVTLLFRERPGSIDPVHTRWLEKYRPADTFILPDSELYPLLRCVDVFTSNFSTTLLNAGYVHTPIMMLQYPNDGDLLGLMRQNLAFIADVQSVDALRQTLENALFDPTAIQDRRQRFDDYMPKLPCTPKFVELIASIA